MTSLFDGVLMDLARKVADGVIRGLMERNTPQSLADHIAADSDLIQEGLRSSDPRDRATIDRLRRMAARYRRLRDRIASTVTVGWFLDPGRWIWRQPRYRAYYVVLNTPQGRAWLERNLKVGIDFFFG